MHNILGLIPARGGSKRLPRKNIRSFLGKPLVAWTIEQAKKSKCLTRVVVTTEDREIAEISKKEGAEVPFLRPEELARDGSPTIDAVLHAVDWFESRGEHFDIVALLEPTSPLRKSDDIDCAIKLFLDNWNKADSLVSLGEVRLENPYIMKKLDDGYIKNFIDVEDSTKVQDKVFFPYGVIYISKTEALRNYRTFYQNRTIPYFIERWQNYEIDDIYEQVCIEAIHAYRSSLIDGP
jgi:CMP-N-acetylneuraminic acid synthetase